MYTRDRWPLRKKTPNQNSRVRTPYRPAVVPIIGPPGRAQRVLKETDLQSLLHFRLITRLSFSLPNVPFKHKDETTYLCGRIWLAVIVVQVQHSHDPVLWWCIHDLYTPLWQRQMCSASSSVGIPNQCIPLSLPTDGLQPRWDLLLAWILPRSEGVTKQSDTQKVSRS